MDFTTILKTPFEALDYLTKGDSKGLTPEQIKRADEWAKEWEITSVEEYLENETLSHNLAKSLIQDMDFEEDDYG